MLRLIALVALFIAGCTTVDVKAPEQRRFEYECGILGRHGVLAKFRGEFTSEVEAQETAEKVRLKLVSDKHISENSGVMCYRPEAQ